MRPPTVSEQYVEDVLRAADDVGALLALRAENQRLREETTQLKTELAIAYGQQRGRP